MILIAYDGSADAQAAIEHAGTLLPGQAATVVTVWEPFTEVLAHSGAGIGLAAGAVDFGAVDSASEKNAADRAAEGVALAQKAGLTAEPATRRQEGSVADAILVEAVQRDATAIVVGTRGLTGVRSVFLGSVSHAVAQHADRPVIVVPSAESAQKRAAHLR